MEVASIGPFKVCVKSPGNTPHNINRASVCMFFLILCRQVAGFREGGDGW